MTGGSKGSAKILVIIRGEEDDSKILGLGITHYPGLSYKGNLTRRIKLLLADNWATWRNTTIEEAEDRGHHELLNWFCLAGAMSALERRPHESVFLESWISNSDKVFAIFRP